MGVFAVFWKRKSRTKGINFELEMRSLVLKNNRESIMGHYIKLVLFSLESVETDHSNGQQQDLCSNSSGSQTTASAAFVPEWSGLGQYLSASLIFVPVSHSRQKRETKYAPWTNHIGCLTSS